MLINVPLLHRFLLLIGCDTKWNLLILYYYSRDVLFQFNEIAMISVGPSWFSLSASRDEPL